MSLAAAILLGAAFLIAAVGKTRVTSQLRSSTVLGAAVLALVPWLRRRPRRLDVVWMAAIGLEVVLGLWLIGGWARPYALTVSAAFFVVALGCVVWALVKVKGSRCGCFGSKTRNSGWVALRCASMAMLGAWAAFPGQGSRGGLLQWTVIAVCSAGALAPSFTAADRLRLRRQVGDRLVFARVLLRERLRGGPDVEDMAEALGGEPYWQELAERLQLRGPRRTWREGRWVLMEHVSRGTDSQVLVVSASCEGTSPLWLRVAVVSSTGTAVETDSLWDSIAARADETAELAETSQLVASSNPAVSP